MKKGGLLLLPLLLASCSCERMKKEEKKEALTIQEIVTFKELENYDKAIVKFYANWCGACKASAQPFAELAADYPHVKFLAFDIDQNGDLKEKFPTQGVPTFIIFEKGNKVDEILGFNLPKIKASLEKTATGKESEEKVAAPQKSKIKNIKDKAHFEKQIKKHENVIVKFYGDWCGFCKMIAPDYEKLSQEYGDKIKFLEVEISKNEDLAKEHDVRGVPLFKTFKKGKAQEIVSGANKPELEKAVKKLAEK